MIGLYEFEDIYELGVCDIDNVATRVIYIQVLHEHLACKGGQVQA